MFATNKRQALYWFNVYSGNLKFVPITIPLYLTEKEYIFSHAIAKFQNLVIFEE